jgi:CheY-like chemotaxis protein
MFRILIIEDIEGTLNQLQELLSEVFPGAQIDTAPAVKEAHELIKEGWDEAQPYQAIILDFKLPAEVGENPEVDESVCKVIKNLTPPPLVAHITAYPQDKLVADHINAFHTKQISPSALALSKLDKDWANQLLESLRAHLYGKRIEEKMEAMFGKEDVAVFHARTRAGREEPVGERSRTHELANLCREISAHWGDIDERLRLRIQRKFLIDDDARPVRVSLRL